jgi:hypothetical protein
VNAANDASRKRTAKTQHGMSVAAPLRSASNREKSVLRMSSLLGGNLAMCAKRVQSRRKVAQSRGLTGELLSPRPMLTDGLARFNPVRVCSEQLIPIECSENSFI